MCGIAGLQIKNNVVHPEEIEKMLNTMVHRGPDQFGIHNEYNYGIGHRRLSIIDLADGKQPMSNEQKTIWITFNGEIYNYKELRVELEEKGYIFKSNSDTEVIIHCYEEYDIDCLGKLRGMFAFCIADNSKRRMFCARDNLGIKPFVYYYDGDTFAFASEIQALKTIQSFDKTIDIKSIDQYLWLQYIPAPNSIYLKVKKLKPGHYITVDFDLNISEQIKWFDFGFSSDTLNKDWKSEFNTVFSNSVEKHLISDVSYGAFLSGGIDSTLVVDYMTKILNKAVETFSIGFENDGNSEVEYAQYAAKLMGTNHHTQIITGDAFKILPELVNHYGEPFGDSSAIPTYYVSRLASDYVKMVLSGDGGDELFCGYPRYIAWNNAENTCNSIKYQLRKIRNILASGGKTLALLNDWLLYVQYLGRDLRKDLWKNEYKQYSSLPLEYFNEICKQTSCFSHLQKAQYIDLKTYMPFDCLTKVDIASMCHSIEVRTPFVDKEVLNLAMNLPQKVTFAETKQYGTQGKYLLKQIMEDRFGSDFVFRKKRGFSIPLNRWITDESNYAYKLKMNLLSPSTKISQFFNTDILKRIVESNNQHHIYVLIFLEEWLNQNC